jgi:hypothetical protein
VEAVEELGALEHWETVELLAWEILEPLLQSILAKWARMVMEA